MIRCVTDNPKALERLEIAFRACPDDFKQMKQEVIAGRVSLYELTGEGYHITVAGEVLGDGYFLWGVAGRGVVAGISELAAYVKNAGLNTITAETYFAGLARLVRRLNTTEQPQAHTTQLTMRV